VGDLGRAAARQRPKQNDVVSFVAIDRWFKRNGAYVTTPHLDGAIRDDRHHMQVRVYYEDTDFSKAVYHANYLRFMERGRTNFLRLLGADQRALFEETQNEAPGFAFVVRSMKIDFFKPAFMDDVLDVVTIPQEVKGASITLLQQCRRGDDLLVEASVRVAFVSGGKAQRIPKALRVAMESDRTQP
jgi:acyl-CoA thioester hydrolase